MDGHTGQVEVASRVNGHSRRLRVESVFKVEVARRTIVRVVRDVARTGS